MAKGFTPSAERFAAIAARSQTPHHERRERFRTWCLGITAFFTLVLAAAAVLTVETFEVKKQRDRAVSERDNALADTRAARGELTESRALASRLRGDIAALDARRAQAETEQERDRLRALQAEAREQQAAARLQAASDEVQRSRLFGRFYGRVLESCVMTDATHGAPDERSFRQCMATVLASDAEFQQLSKADAATMFARARRPAPSVSFLVNPTNVAANGLATLTWSSTNASACTASGGWSGSRASAGTQQIGPIFNTSTFTLQCTGPGGSSAARSVTVTAVAGGSSSEYVADSGGGPLDLIVVITLSVLVVGRALVIRSVRLSTRERAIW